MQKFMIEVDHPGDTYACAQVIKLFLESGSHFLVNAEWGCMDDVHKSWFIMEADNRTEALMVVPVQLRAHARAIQLCRFSMAQIDDILRHHKPTTS